MYRKQGLFGVMLTAMWGLASASYANDATITEAHVTFEDLDMIVTLEGFDFGDSNTFNELHWANGSGALDLEVQEWSDEKAIGTTELLEPLEPGAYLAILNPNGQSIATIAITIGAVGPLGPQGEQGDPGPRGEQGPPGEQGPRGDDATQVWSLNAQERPYWLGDRVGIGTATPADNLHVVQAGSISDSFVVVEAEGPNRRAMLSLKNGVEKYWAGVGTDGEFYIVNRTNDVSTSGIVVSPEGNVGVGKLSVGDSALEVEGYLEVDTTSGAPAAEDCSATGDAGRVVVDQANNALYFCGGSDGWVSLSGN